MSSRLERGWGEEGKRTWGEGIIMGTVLEAHLQRTLHWMECSWLQSHLWINTFTSDCRTSNVLDCGTAGCYVTDACQVRNVLLFGWQWWWISRNRLMSWISHSRSGIYNTRRVWSMSIRERVGRDHNQESCHGGAAASWGPNILALNERWSIEAWTSDWSCGSIRDQVQSFLLGKGHPPCLLLIAPSQQLIVGTYSLLHCLIYHLLNTFSICKCKQ